MNTELKPKKKARKKRHEAEFSTEFRRGAAHDGFHVVHIVDDGRPGGTRQKPYDVILMRNQITHSCELKQSGKRYLETSALEDHQVENLEQAYRQGAMSWVICVFHDVEARWREVYAAFHRHFATARDIDKRPSLDLEWWRKWGVRLPKVRAPILDRKTGKPKVYEDGKQRFGRSWSAAPLEAAAKMHFRVRLDQQLHEMGCVTKAELDETMSKYGLGKIGVNEARKTIGLPPLPDYLALSPNGLLAPKGMNQ